MVGRTVLPVHRRKRIAQPLYCMPYRKFTCRNSIGKRTLGCYFVAPIRRRHVFDDRGREITKRCWLVLVDLRKLDEGRISTFLH